MYRLIASDLDETLLDSDHRVPERVRRAISAARELGVKFVPATGRPYESADAPSRSSASLARPASTCSPSTAGSSRRTRTAAPLTSCGLPAKTAEALYQAGIERGLCIHVYTLEHVYLYNYWPVERSYIEGRMNIVETAEKSLDFLSKTGEHVVKLLFIRAISE